VFIGFKAHLNVIEAPTLVTDNKAILAKLHVSGNKYIYLCSFYHPHNNDPYSITQIGEALP